MPRHINHPHRAAIGQLKAREAEVDGHASFLFFLEAVGVDAGQGAHKRGLAVVDVAGGADDDGLNVHGQIDTGPDHCAQLCQRTRRNRPYWGHFY